MADAQSEIDRLLDVMAALRHPETGCPWDLEQTFETIIPYTIEEAYEVADAIDRGNLDDLKDELGDLLLQVAYHARLAEERGAFAFSDVANTIADKMIRRHPHVFGDVAANGTDGVKLRWEEIKAAERAAKSTPGAGLLADVATALPALSRAMKLQRRAASVGFDWTEVEEVAAKVREELSEVEAQVAADPRRPEQIEAEIGDLLFTVVNLARHLDVDPETALRGANRRFSTRFAFVEATLNKAGRSLDDASAMELEAAWNAAKAVEVT